MDFCLCVALLTMSVPRSDGRSDLLGRQHLTSLWPWWRYDTKFSEQTRTPPGPSPPPGTAISKFAPFPHGSAHLLTTWFKPRSSS